MNILSIGYGRHLFDTNNIEHRRLSLCAKESGSIDHIVFTLARDGFSSLSAEDNFRLHPTNSKHKIFMIFDAIRLGSRIVRQQRIDVISTQDLFETGVVGLLLKFRYSQLTLQVQEHGDVMGSKHWRREKFSNRLRYWFGLLLLKRADIVRVVSERTKVFLQKKLDSKKSIKKLPVVIDTESFSTVHENRIKKENNNFIFITAARFVPQKNFPLMLRAFSAVHAEYPHVRLRIFGEGSLGPTIKRMVSELGLSQAVSMQGWANDLAIEMSRADAYLLASNYEGWGRVLVEAMLQRLPIVTTDVGCAGEVIKNKEHGLVVPVDDLEALANAMKTICSNTDLYQKLQDNLAQLKVQDVPGTRIEEYAALWVQTMR